MSLFDSLTRTPQITIDGRLRPRITISWTFCATISFPACVTQVSPSGRLFPDHQAELVARVEERLGLRIVRAAHDVAVEIAAQDFGLVPHHTRRHGEPHVRVHFVPIQPEQVDALAVEEKAILFEACLAKADASSVLVHRLPPAESLVTTV